MEEESQSPHVPTPIETPPVLASPPQPGKFTRTLTPRQKKGLIIGGGGLGILVLAYAAYALILQNRGEIGNCTVSDTRDVCLEAVPLVTGQSTEKGTIPDSTPTASATPSVTLVPATLNGGGVPSGKENLHPLAVMIENHPQARPQAGLGQASLVYEAIAEGGITRFMAVFADPTFPVKVGPIRSARLYFVDLATELKAFYAHVGGNINALDQIRNTGVLDLDQFNIGEPTFKRDLSRQVSLEHTMHSSTEKLWEYATVKKRWSTAASFEPWLFQDDVALESRPTSHTVNVSVSDAQYAVRWAYDRNTNAYLRSQAGTPHVDANTGIQIAAKTLILQKVSREPITSRDGKDVWNFRLTGSGSATVFQNGTATPATWKKSGTGRTRYFASDGKEIPLNRGLIWVQFIHPDSSVTF